MLSCSGSRYTICVLDSSASKKQLLIFQIKLGFDHEYFVGAVSDEHARIYEIALQAQAAALETIRPGVSAEDVHFASLEV